MNINERKVLDQMQKRIIEKGIKTLIVDAGYRDKKRATIFAKAQVMLLTPDLSVEKAEAVFGSMDAMAIAVFNETKASRKIAIEPTFDLLSKLLATNRKHNLYLSAVCYTSPPYGNWCYDFTTRNVDESSLGASHTKSYTH